MHQRLINHPGFDDQKKFRNGLFWSTIEAFPNLEINAATAAKDRPNMSEQDNIDLVKTAYEKFGAEDIPGLLSLFADDIEWTTPNVENAFFGGTINGTTAVTDFFGKLAETENFSNFEPKEFIASGDRVVSLGTSTSTVTDTGREYTTDWVHIFTVRNSKIESFLEFFDTAEVNRAFQKATTA